MAELSKDVVFYGCGEKNNKKRKTNNPLYKDLLNDNWENYKNVRNNTEKREFVERQIVDPIQYDGGRFLDDNGNPMTSEQIFEKVSQALRDVRKQKMKAMIAEEKRTKKKCSMAKFVGSASSEREDDKQKQDELCKASEMISELKDAILSLKDGYRSKTEDILLEAIVTQEELAIQQQLNMEKDALIKSQQDEILVLKEAIVLLKQRSQQLEAMLGRNSSN